MPGKVAQIKKMVTAEHRLVRDSGFLQHFAKFGMHPRILSFPERAERVFIRVTRIGRRLAGPRILRRLTNQVHVAIGAAREARTVLGIAFRAKHCVPQSTASPGKMRARRSLPQYFGVTPKLLKRNKDTMAGIS